MKSSELETDPAAVAYRQRHPVLMRLAASLNSHIEELLKGYARIDRISARAKDIERFTKKANARTNGDLKYTQPLSQIQDQIGARIIVFYKSDVDIIDELIRRYFTTVEYRTVVPDSETEFSYFGRHLILVIPSDIIDDDMDQELIPDFFELQIKTLFQHAWSEAHHDLGYKPGDTPLTSDQKRLVAFTSAQAWGADHMFNQLFQELTPNSSSGQL